MRKIIKGGAIVLEEQVTRNVKVVIGVPIKKQIITRDMGEDLTAKKNMPDMKKSHMFHQKTTKGIKPRNMKRNSFMEN